MKNDILVSVVVPAYNTEKYIEPMIESLEKQTYGNLQIIFIDDGSSDSTAAVIKKYQNTDPRIEYYYQENQGVSKARNWGLEKVRGEKLFLFDSDDTFDESLIADCLEYAEAHGVDAVLYGYAAKIDGRVENEHSFELHGDFYNEDIATKVSPAFLGHSYSDINEWIKGKKALRSGKEHTALWRIMLDVDTIKKAAIQFDTLLSLGEDTKFINTYLLYAASLGILEKTLYYLTIRDGSANATSNGNPELMTRNKIKLIEARKQIDGIAVEKGIDTHGYWQGTLVLSAVQLALRLSHNKSLSNKENRIVYSEYMNNPDVKSAIAQFSPSFSVKAIPFWMLKMHLSRILYFLCKILPERITNKFM